jgi:ABC-type sugar transport system ATPase subunit
MVYVTHDQVEAMSMADRVAVMNLGVLQQYAAPDELYNRPSNRFVANFIGSVLNNFLPCVYERAAGRATVRIVGGEGAPIDVTDRDTVVGQHVDPGGRLTASIRPELVRLVAPDSPDALLRARISLVEPLGAKDVVHLTYDSSDIRAIGVPGNRPTVGDNVGLSFDPARMHLFDDETGRALR